MAKQRPDFDGFFRENISEYELSKEKGNWKLLNHLLDEKERRKKNRLLLLFIFSLFLLLSAGLFLVLPSQEMKENAGTTIKSNAVAHSSEVPSSSEKENIRASGNVVPSEKNKKGHGTDYNVQLKRNEKSPSTTEGRRENQLIVQKEDGEIARSVNKTEAPVPEMIPLDIISTKPGSLAVHDSGETILPEIKIYERVVVTPSQIWKEDSSTPNAVTIEAVNKSSFVYDSLSAKSAGNDSLDVIANNNSSSDTTTLKQISSAKTRFLNLNLFAGINIYSAANVSLSKAQNISPLIGLEFQHLITPHFSIGLGGFYSPQGGYHLSDTARKVSYFLDENVSQQTIQIQRLHKLYFPLILYYALSARHSVSAGVQLSYLINTVGDYADLIKVSGSTTASQKNNVRGYMDGIKSTNVSLSLGYKFSFTKRFDLSARISRELSPSYTTEYFYGVSTTPCWSLHTFLIARF